uniref:protein-tyrosine-phosphatase n=1 Tax=Gopherus evgoodei TaxID=1825980 RepID=A0A8C4YG76_9SAUR
EKICIRRQGIGSDAEALLNVSVSDQGRPDSLFLSWDEPDGGALGYTLAIYMLEPEVLLQNGSAGLNATSFQFQGLVPGATYNAVCVVFGTGPAPVHNLSLSSDGSPLALRASWMDAPGQKDGYRLVLYHLDSQGAVRNESVPGAISTFLFDGLLAGSEYALRISTLAGARQASTSTHQWTAPTTPAALTLQSLGSSTSLFASWSRAEGAAWLHLTLHNLLSHLVTRTVSAKRGLSNYTFQHLSPGTLYHLGVSAAAGPYWAAGPNATAWTYPLAPSGVTLTSKRHPLGLSAAWHRASGDRDQFLIHFYSKELLMQQNFSVGPDTQNFTFLGLLPGIQYSVEVMALAGPYRASAPSATAWTYPGIACSTGDSGSVHAAVRGALAAASPLMPLSPAMTNGGSTSALVVHWEAPAGQRDGYLVSVYEEGSLAAGRHVNVGKDSTNVSLAGLAPGSCYHVGISALAGPYSSDPQNVTGCTVPAAPANVSLTNSGSCSVLRAAWDEPPGGRDHYRVILYSLAPWGIQTAQSLGPNAQNITWTHLAAGSRFTAQVIAVKGPYESSSVNVTQWTCDPQHIPTLPSASALQVSWTGAEGRGEGYTVDLYNASSGRHVGHTLLPWGARNHTFQSLTPGTCYSVGVSTTAGPYHSSTPNLTHWTRECLTLQPGAPVTALAWGDPSPPRVLSHMASSPVCHFHSICPWTWGKPHFFQGLVPGRNYSVSLSCVAGPYWSSTGILVVPIAPDPVEDLQCQPDSKGFSLSWTFPPGDVEACELAAERLSGGPPQAEARVIAPGSKTSLWGLEPDSSYRISVSAVGRNELRSRAVTLVCNTSAEVLPPLVRADVPRVEPGSRVLLSPDTFSEENGRIEYYAVIVTSNESLSRPTQETVSSTWYDHYYGQEDSYMAVLLPNPFHPDKRSTPQTWSVPVGTDECGQSREICNGKLKANAQYRWGPLVWSGADPSPDSLEIIPLWGGIFSHRQGHNFISCRNVHRPMPIQSFKQYYEAKTANANHGFFQDFAELKEVGKEQPKVEAELPANVSKNRYPHVLPYDHSRVRLSLLREEPHSDYINANYPPGNSHTQGGIEFIVTQGPLKKTIEDFWRLVWEQSVCNIIMLTVGMENGRVLCDHYWPSELSPVSYGHICVDLLSQGSADEWTTRTFKLWHVSEQLRGRHVTHLHYTAWPDHGIPESTASLMAFLDLARGHMQKAKGSGPTLVHCSAGVGRSGTFIALDRLLQQLKQEKVVDVFNTIYTMRMSRYSMIQTLVRPWTFSLQPCCQISRARREPRARLALPPLGTTVLSEACWPLEGSPVYTEMLTIQRGPEKHVSGWRCIQLKLKHVCASEGRGAGFSRQKGIGLMVLPPSAAPSSSGIGQMGMLITLDCLLHQMKAERSVDVYGVTLRLMRSCCLMTPTPVGGEEGGRLGQVYPRKAMARCRTEARSWVQ